MPNIARWRHLALALGLAVAAVACLSACTATPNPTTATATAAPKVVGATDAPTIVPNDPDLRKDVTMTSCGAAKGGWQAGGKIVNHSSTARGYHVEVFFTSLETTVLGSGLVRVHVDAGASKAWKIEDKFTPAKPTVCVVTGVS
ncbi:MAG TPA: hypothetical protein VK537_03000 [Galbitalea sp.]|nr:hypothetical protein [Galbitalea sp.]